jgi:hypothetical protein
MSTGPAWPPRPSPGLLAVLAEYFADGPAGMVAWRDRYVDRCAELRVIGTAGEWLAGDDAFAVLADESAHADTDVEVVVRDAEAFESGDTGWAACRPEVVLPDGSRLSLRWSAVFERTHGTWRLRQLHVSRALG